MIPPCRRPPFDLTPDPGMFFPGRGILPVLERLLAALAAGEGVVTVTGGAGCGKTLLARLVRETLVSARGAVIHLAHPAPGPELLWRAVLEELGGGWESGPFDPLGAIDRRLRQRFPRGGRLLLLLDEAHALAPATVEAVRLLCDLEPVRVQVVLLGREGLPGQLGALGERVTASLRLAPLTAGEVAVYLATRLERAGYQGSVPLFADGCADALFRHTRGNPRQINRLAHLALARARQAGASRVTAGEIAAAARESAGGTGRGRVPEALAACGAGVLLWFFFQEGNGEAPPAPVVAHARVIRAQVAARVAAPGTPPPVLPAAAPVPAVESSPGPEDEDLGLASPPPAPDPPVARGPRPAAMEIRASSPEGAGEPPPAPGADDLEQVRARAALAWRAGRLEEAIALLERVVLRGGFRAEVVGELAFLHQKRGDFRQAAALYRQLLAREPDRGNWWLGLGVSLEGLGERREAATAFWRAGNDPALPPSAARYARERRQWLEGG